MFGFYLTRLAERLLAMKKSHRAISAEDIETIVTICLGGTR